MTNPSEIDSDSLLAVKNLRFRFEMLSSSTSTSPSPALTPSSSSVHRLERSSVSDGSSEGNEGEKERLEGSSRGSPGRQGTELDAQLTGQSTLSADSRLHLRSSSSLSDLKRRPPPPPPRGSKVPSRSPSPAPSAGSSASPLLRPVPAPPPNFNSSSLFLGVPSPGPSPGPRPVVANTIGGEGEVEEGQTQTPSVALLKSRFNSPAPSPRISSPSPGSSNRPLSQRIEGLPVAASSISSTRTTPALASRPVPAPTSSYSSSTTYTPPPVHSKPPPPPPISTPAPASVPVGTPQSSLSSLHNIPQPPHSLSSLHGKTPSISIFASPSPSALPFSPSTPSTAARPAIPPRPPKTVHIEQPQPLLREGAILSSHQLSQSPEQLQVMSSIHGRERCDDEGTGSTHATPPPPVPARANGLRGVREGKIDSPGCDTQGTARLPPPPPRHRTSLSPAVTDTITPSSTAAATSSSAPSGKGGLAPPLPIRRSTVASDDSPSQSQSQSQPQPQSRTSRPPPPPPTQKLTVSASSPISTDQPPSSTERKPIGSNRLPPPPTRTIAPGSKLPARRPTSPSSDEESPGDEDDPRASAVEMLPDTSTSSRRLPILSFRYTDSEAQHLPQPKIPIHPHNGYVATSGSTVVTAHSHSLKIYDLAQGDSVLFTVDTKDAGVKEGKITCLEFRASSERRKAEEGGDGYMLWVGTKEGHIFEVDTRSGTVCALRPGAHLYPITYMFRHGENMVSMDESGKALVFSPENDMEMSLANTIPRVARTTEKQDFAKMIGGKLWTAARGESSSTLSTSASSSSHKTPIIRVFDVFNPVGTGRSLIPSEHVGAVTSGTILPSHPGHVYLGHEEGYISIWSVLGEDDHPRCVDVVRVSLSDVLCLEGVNDRLWAGGRNGMISAYDVSHRPWLVTNSWNAHPGLPVLRLGVNIFGVEKVGRLCVFSVGRDECVRFWDGLLGLDWVDKELMKSEPQYSTFRDITALIVSWNCDSAKPDALSGDPINSTFLTDVLHSVPGGPDIMAFGFQEVIDLESRKMTAKNVLLGSKKKEDMGLSDKVTGAYRRWYDRLVSVVRSSMPPDMQYSVVHTESLVGLFSCIFIKTSEKTHLNDVAVTTVKRGMGGRYGNKGGIVARFVIGDSSVCIINSHLAAGQNAVRRRNADAASILEEKAVFPTAEHPLAYVGGGDGTTVLDHEIVFFHGDLNYRIEARRDAIIAAVRAGDYASLIPHDQLIRELKYNRAFRLRGFSEGPLTFAPTYKYDPRSNEYDTSEKHRSPAWCDRVLWKSRIPSRVRQLHYQRYEANVSDHRPISAAFSITVKTLQHEARDNIKAVVEAMWIDEQQRLLAAARDFYACQALI